MKKPNFSLFPTALCEELSIWQTHQEHKWESFIVPDDDSILGACGGASADVHPIAYTHGRSALEKHSENRLQKSKGEDENSALGACGGVSTADGHRITYTPAFVQMREENKFRFNIMSSDKKFAMILEDTLQQWIGMISSFLPLSLWLQGVLS